MNKLLLPALLALSFVLLAGCVAQGIEIPDIVQGVDEDGIGPVEMNLPDDIGASVQNAPKKFESIDELRKYLADNTVSRDNYYKDERMNSDSSSIMDLGIAVADVLAAPAASGSELSDYSGTNVQVAGVDEADFVKTNGEYIYLIDDGKLIIVDAKDAENAKIIFEQKLFKGSDENYGRRALPEQMFISGDKLAIFASVPRKEIEFDKYDITPKESYKDYTGLYVFNISEPNEPELLSDILVLGRYYQSRMIGDVIYFVSQENTYGEAYPPIVYEGDEIFRPEVYYFDNPQDEYIFNTITSYDLPNEKMIDSKTYLMGSSNTLMMSQSNIFIAYRERQPWCRWCYYDERYERDRFDEVIVPMLPQSVRDEIAQIESQELHEEQEWQKLSDLLLEYFAPAISDEKGRYSEETVKERENGLREMEDALAEYDAIKQIENSKTIIQRFSVDDGKIDYVAQGAVHGYLLNQFSMDEYDGNLRVATTVNVWAKKRIQYNNVYVLDGAMETVGKLEKIAKDEKIYSARFMGKRLYLVTFKQIDPFLAIDLSDAATPEILGELKIPGYSSYLHPYSEDIIIGIGKETEENEWGATTTKGVKISLFNVANPANPTEIDKMEFGDSGSDSAVLYDHKAFLLDAGKDLMVLPLKVVKREEGFFTDTTSTWDGAVAVKITEDGFEKYGIIKHDVTEDYWGGWRSSSTVERSLYIGDVLYTISDEKMMVNEIAQDMPEIKSIELDEEDEEGLIPDGTDIIRGIILPFIK